MSASGLPVPADHPLLSILAQKGSLLQALGPGMELCYAVPCGWASVPTSLAGGMPMVEFTPGGMLPPEIAGKLPMTIWTGSNSVIGPIAMGDVASAMFATAALIATGRMGISYPLCALIPKKQLDAAEAQLLPTMSDQKALPSHGSASSFIRS